MTSTITRGQMAFALLAVLAAILCVRLGFWQLDRHHERQRAAEARAARLSEPPVSLASVLSDSSRLSDSPSSAPDALAWRRVILSGSWDYGGEVLIRSRGMDGRPGVHVVTPLQVAVNGLEPGPATVLVLRGWLPAPDAIEPATISTADPGIGAAEARTGVIRPSRDGAGLPVVIAGEGADRRRTFAAIDLEAIRSAGSGAETAGAAGAGPHGVLETRFFVQLLPADDGAAPAGRPPGTPVPVPLPPAGSGPHLAYAIQWFSFALIALIGTGAFLLQQRRGRRPTSGARVREGPTPD